MATSTTNAALLLALSSLAMAQFGNPSGGGDPYSGGSGSDGGDPYGSDGFGFFFDHRTAVITAHAVLATVAFGFLFPVGGIMIRLASFRGLWLVHGIFQVFAYILVVGAVALGLYMVHEIPSQAHVWNNAHPIIGLVAFAILFLQPWLGLLHHLAFKKHSRRVFWSHAHIWVGRIVILLGIINGGLGLQLSQSFGIFAPSRGVVIGYAVGAGIMYVLYLFSVVLGELKRKRTQREAVRNSPPPYKRERDGDDSREDVVYA